ncbi:MAG: ComEC/Rec2 family competence protein, partial [Nitrospinota bacterium]
MGFAPPAPLPTVALAYVVGTVMAALVELPLAAAGVVLLSSLLLWAGFRSGRVGLALLAAASLLGGTLRPALLERQLPSHHLKRRLPAGRTHLAGVVREPVARGLKLRRIVVGVEELLERGVRVPAAGKARLSLYGGGPELHYGDRVLVRWVQLRRPRGYANPGGFDFGAYLDRQGVSAVGAVSARRVETLERHGGNPLLGLLFAARRRMVAFLKGRLPTPHGELLSALALGEREGLPPEVKQIFARSGTGHLLAISGLHVGFVAFAFFLLFRFAFRELPPRWYPIRPIVFTPAKAAALAVIPVVVLYALLTGARVSTVRASIMVVVYLLARIAEREKALLETLLLAAFLILLWNPNALGDAGFQLSFLSVFAIALALPRLPQPEGRWRRRAVQFAIITLVVGMAVLPLAARYFHRVSLVGPLANLALIPVASLVVPLALVVSAMSLLWEELAGLAAAPLYLLTEVLLRGAYFFSSLPHASVQVFPPRAPEMVLFVVAMSFLLAASTWRRRGEGLLCLALAGALYLGPQLFAREGGNLSLTFLEAGRVDAAHLRLPDGRSFVLDGGGSSGRFDVWEQVVARYLLWERRGKVAGLLSVVRAPLASRSGRMLREGFHLKREAAISLRELAPLRWEVAARPDADFSLESDAPAHPATLRTLRVRHGRVRFHLLFALGRLRGKKPPAPPAGEAPDLIKVPEGLL